MWLLPWHSTELFFSWLSKVIHSAIKTFNSKLVEAGNAILQNHWSYDIKVNSKITLKMDFSVPCCYLHRIFFSWLSTVTNSAIKTFNSKKVESGNDLSQNYFVVIMSKPIRKIRLKMIFSFHATTVNSFFFSSQLYTSKTLNSKKVESGNGISWNWKKYFKDSL